jgi:hypothetical protein
MAKLAKREIWKELQAHLSVRQGNPKGDLRSGLGAAAQEKSLCLNETDSRSLFQPGKDLL